VKFNETDEHGLIINAGQVVFLPIGPNIKLYAHSVYVEEVEVFIVELT
jgi:hypothetical protein